MGRLRRSDFDYSDVDNALEVKEVAKSESVKGESTLFVCVHVRFNGEEIQKSADGAARQVPYNALKLVSEKRLGVRVPQK